MSPNSTTDPIGTVEHFSTGTGALHREHRYGSRWPRLIWALTSTSWLPCPINVFVIHHPDGPVLFDTGLDPAIDTDPGYVGGPVNRFFQRRLFRMSITPDDALDRQLALIGLAGEDIRKVVISHLHFDHVGGIRHVPQADLLVSRDEWRLLDGPHPERDFILADHIDIPGARWRPIDFAPTDNPLFAPFGGIYDVMGDGALILLPTPGHTPGSLSMLVRQDGHAPLLLVGDLTYDAEMLMNDRLPGTGDAALLRASFANVRLLKQQLPGLVILPGHDVVRLDSDERVS